MHAQDLLPLLRAFALKTRSPNIDLRQFHASLSKGEAQPGEVEAAIADLPAESVIVVSKENQRPRIITLPDFHVIALVDEYRRLGDEPGRPFPREETAPAKIPANTLIAADVKAQLGALMETSGPGMKGIVRLQFPEGVDSLLVPQESVGSPLVDAAVAKISRYLQDGKNAAYAETKLVGALRGSEVTVRQYMEDVALRPKKASATVTAPTDFSFRFWTHLSNLVLQDFRAKAERTDQDMAVVQSAYIIGYAVFHKKGAVQREKEWADDRKSLETQVRKAPFVFGFQDLYSLKDDKGATFVAKHSRDFIHSFLKEKTTRTAGETIPSLVRVHAAAQKKDYFIHRDFVVPVFLKKVAECAEELRRQYLDEWTAALKEDRTPDKAKSDASFRRDVEAKVTQGFPLLTALANGGLLYLLGEEARIGDDAKKELRKCFAVENILRPFDELLGLSRVQLLKNARMYLPFWMTIPILGPILRLFRRLLGARGRARDGGGSSKTEPPVRPEAKIVARPVTEEAGPKAQNRENLLHYKRSVQSLISQYVPKGSTIDGTLSELAERWNPLYASAQKKNLVEDVNALVRDFLRPIRRSFLVRPPDLRRIHALAEQLSASKALAQIKKRDILMRYIELYMVRCLQVKQL
ncbi:MAG: hypothetical protein ABSG21_11015 [Spirochaetia bacterium]|jgi:hypothetical protein